MPDEIKMGSTVQDTVTGMFGTVVSRVEYWNDAPSFGVEPLELKNGCRQKTEYFHTHRIVAYEPPADGS